MIRIRGEWSRRSRLCITAIITTTASVTTTQCSMGNSTIRNGIQNIIANCVLEILVVDCHYSHWCSITLSTNFFYIFLNSLQNKQSKLCRAPVVIILSMSMSMALALSLLVWSSFLVLGSSSLYSMQIDCHLCSHKPPNYRISKIPEDLTGLVDLPRNLTRLSHETSGIGRAGAHMHIPFFICISIPSAVIAVSISIG